MSWAFDRMEEEASTLGLVQLEGPRALSRGLLPHPRPLCDNRMNNQTKKER